MNTQTTTDSPKTTTAPSVGSGDLFGSLRDRILKQRRISYADYQDLRSAHILMEDPAASMVWRLIKTYERHNLSVMPLHAGEIEAIAESWPNAADVGRADNAGPASAKPTSNH